MASILFPAICIFWLFYALSEACEKPKKPHFNVKKYTPPIEVSGTETCHPLASDFMHYSWKSDCKTYVFHSSASNLEAARSKCQRDFEERGILPRFNRN